MEHWYELCSDELESKANTLQIVFYINVMDRHKCCCFTSLCFDIVNNLNVFVTYVCEESFDE